MLLLELQKKKKNFNLSVSLNPLSSIAGTCLNGFTFSYSAVLFSSVHTEQKQTYQQYWSSNGDSSELACCSNGNAV